VRQVSFRSPEELKQEFRLLAQEAVILVTRDSSNPLKGVDDWLDRLLSEHHSWDGSMEQLLAASRDHLRTRRLYELGLCHAQLAEQCGVLASRFDELLFRFFRSKRTADLNATYARHHGRSQLEAGRQEALLQDARAWAASTFRKVAPEVKDTLGIKALLVRQTWDEFVPRHPNYSDFRLGYREFESALWEEGSPSLADFAGGVTRVPSLSASEEPDTSALDAPSGPVEPTPRRRGRKSRFSREQLRQANEMKSAGKTNQEIAKVLYSSNPTAAQRRSVPTILSHHFGPNGKIEQ
jgi:hypothetical protein